MAATSARSCSRPTRTPTASSCGSGRRGVEGPHQVLHLGPQRQELGPPLDRQVAVVAPAATARSATIRPGWLPSTMTRWPRKTASSTSWVTISTVVPVSGQTWRMRTCMSSLVCTSSAPNGSSSSSTSGSQASARAIATRCRCPPESCRGSARRRRGQAGLGEVPGDPAGPLGPGQPGQQLQPERDVALHRAPRDTRAPAWNTRPRSGPGPVTGSPSSSDRARGRPGQAGDQRQQGGLARAAGARPRTRTRPRDSRRSMPSSARGTPGPGSPWSTPRSSSVPRHMTHRPTRSRRSRSTTSISDADHADHDEHREDLVGLQEPLRADDPVAQPGRRRDQLGHHDEVPRRGRVDPDRVDHAGQRVRDDHLAQHLAGTGAQGVRDVDERASARCGPRPRSSAC